MAKAILEYDLNDADDCMAHERAVKSLDMALVLWELMYNVRKPIQRQIEDGKYKEQEDVLAEVFLRFYDLLNEHGIVMDNLVN